MPPPLLPLRSAALSFFLPASCAYVHSVAPPSSSLASAHMPMASRLSPPSCCCAAPHEPSHPWPAALVGLRQHLWPLPSPWPSPGHGRHRLGRATPPPLLRPRSVPAIDRAMSAGAEKPASTAIVIVAPPARRHFPPHVCVRERASSTALPFRAPPLPPTSS